MARIFWLTLVSAVLVAGCAPASNEASSLREPGEVRLADPSSPALASPSAGQPVAYPDDTAQPVLLNGSAGCGAVRPAGDSEEFLVVDGDNRSYRIHVPSGYQASRTHPLVLNFHGSGRMAAEQEAYSGLIEYADREGFILVTPQAIGYGREWDIVGIYGDFGIDDVAFTAAILDRVEAEACVDIARVYATGMSNGAEMASEIACRMPERIAAFAPVAGLIYDDCTDGAVPVISFHGTDDYNVPFDYIPDDFASWAAHNGCGNRLVTEQWTASIERRSYEGCGRNDAVLYVVNGGGHQWPGAADESGGVGFMTQEISATALIWQFFSEHRKPWPAPE